MPHRGGRTVAGIGALGLLWIVVYWLWPVQPRPKVTPDSTGASQPAAKSPPPGIPEPLSAPPDFTPAAPEFIQHTVTEGETFATISERYFGTRAHAEAIARANPLTSPDRLRQGRVIRVPKNPAAIQGPVQGRSVALPEAEYTVRKGDTLSDIAKRVYGDARLASVILEANRDRLRDGDTLREGQTLRIPRRRPEDGR